MSGQVKLNKQIYEAGLVFSNYQKGRENSKGGQNESLKKYKTWDERAIGDMHIVLQ
jgi:hypothetical protein